MWQTASPWRPLSAFSLALHRLLRSLVSLKQVIINAAHYLVLGDKEAYEFDPGTPFLQMVSPPLHLLERSCGVGRYYLESRYWWVLCLFCLPCSAVQIPCLWSISWTG